MREALKTASGYEYGEVISALQKDIRRGNEEAAMFWALELYERYSNALWTRLRVIVNEDIGLANPQALLLVDAQASHYEWCPKEGSKRLILANTILYLCRSEKSREADHFQCVINQRRQQEGWHLEIPDYALDKHTRRGAQMGRGWKHWFDEGCKLFLGVADKYQAEAQKWWPTMKKVKATKSGRSLDPDPEDDDAPSLFDHAGHTDASQEGPAG